MLRLILENKENMKEVMARWGFKSRSESLTSLNWMNQSLEMSLNF